MEHSKSEPSNLCGWLVWNAIERDFGLGGPRVSLSRLVEYIASSRNYFVRRSYRWSDQYGCIRELRAKYSSACKRLSFCNSRRSVFCSIFTVGETLSFPPRISRADRVLSFPPRYGRMLTFPRKYANNADIHLFYKPPAAVLRSYKTIRAENAEPYSKRDTWIYLHVLFITSLINTRTLKKHSRTIPNIVEETWAKWIYSNYRIALTRKTLFFTNKENREGCGCAW